MGASFNMFLQLAVPSHHYSHFSWELGQWPHLNLIRPLESSPVRLFIPPGVLAAALRCLYHTEALLPRCCPSYRGLQAVTPWGAATAFPHYPVVVCGASHPRMCHGNALSQAPGLIHRQYW
jgi:hypothetical protein